MKLTRPQQWAVDLMKNGDLLKEISIHTSPSQQITIYKIGVVKIDPRTFRSLLDKNIIGFHKEERYTTKYYILL